MKRKINIRNNAAVMPIDHIAAANGKYLSVEDKIVVEGTKLLSNTKTADSVKKRKIISTVEKMNSAIIEAEWGQTS
jgi:hypothetical protein